MSAMDILLFVLVILVGAAMIGWGIYLLLKVESEHSNNVTWGIIFIAIGLLICVLYTVFG